MQDHGAVTGSLQGSGQVERATDVGYGHVFRIQGQDLIQDGCDERVRLRGPSEEVITSRSTAAETRSQDAHIQSRDTGEQPGIQVVSAAVVPGRTWLEQRSPSG